MTDRPIVSAIIIFFNARAFIREAIESVLAQTYPYWELLLVDDGSSDGSTRIARKYAGRFPGKIAYHEHPGHQNQGMSASRNLGIGLARGKYVAFLDADDLWLPEKLAQQTAVLDAFPEAGMLYGETLYWHSWTGKPDDLRKDYFPRLGVATGVPIPPLRLLPLFLRGKAAVPCTCSIIVRREVIERVGGFEAGFKGSYEDQAFYAKVCLATSVIAVDACWDRYRQHPASNTALSAARSQEGLARASFLDWLQNYLTQEGIQDRQVWQAVQKELWLNRTPGWLPLSAGVRTSLRWIKKWILQLEERILPSAIRNRLWI